jgi:hypothetical protein
MSGKGRRIPIVAECADLVEGHLVRFRELWLEDGRMRVEYEIWPSVPIAAAFVGHATHFWRSVRAEDDRGNLYRASGGAYGPLGDETGRFGAGHIWLQGPPLRATTLRVTVEPIADSSSSRPCDFTVRLDTRPPTELASDDGS